MPFFYLFVLISFSLSSCSEDITQHGTSHFENLPYAITQIIVSYFDQSSLQSLRLTAKKTKKRIDHLIDWNDIFKPNILLVKHKEKWRDYIENYTPLKYCMHYYKPDFEKLKDLFKIQPPGSIFNDNYPKINNSYFLRTTPINTHFNKKSLVLFFNCIFFKYENKNFYDELPKIKHFIEQFDLDDYYFTSFLKKAIKRKLLSSVRENVDSHASAFMFHINIHYGPVRGKKIIDYYTYLCKKLQILDNEIKKKLIYRPDEYIYALRKDMENIEFQAYTILLSIWQSSSSFLENINPTLLLQEKSKNGVIKRPSKITKLYLMLYALNQEYSKTWFINWFCLITKQIDQYKKQYNWMMCEMEDLLCNTRTPCPLFEKINEKETIYDKLKNDYAEYTVTNMPLYKVALQHYLALGSLATIKKDEFELHKIMPELLEIADQQVIMPWKKHPTDVYYEDKALNYLSLCKQAQVWFYEELKIKFVQNMFNTTKDINFNKNPAILHIMRQPSKYLVDLEIPQQKIIFWIDFSDIELFFSLIRNCTKQKIKQEKIVNLIVPWLCLHKNYNDIAYFLKKLTNSKSLANVYSDIKKHKIVSIYLKKTFLYYYIKKFLLHCFCAILLSKLINMYINLTQEN